MTTKKHGSGAPQSPYKGWQTMTEAAVSAPFSRQRLHVLVLADRIPHRNIPGTSIILVPKPLPKPKAPV